jgi:hypothetical protein
MQRKKQKKRVWTRVSVRMRMKLLAEKKLRKRAQMKLGSLLHEDVDR